MRGKLRITERFFYATVLWALAIFVAANALGETGWDAGPGGFGDERPRHRGRPRGDQQMSEEGQGVEEGEHRGPGGHHKGPGPGGKEVFEACATSLGITLPAKGSGTKLEDSQKESLRACVKAKMDERKAAMHACLMAAGIEFGDDGRPKTRPTREQMDSCRSTVEGGSTDTATSTSTDTSTSNSTSAI